MKKQSVFKISFLLFFSCILLTQCRKINNTETDDILVVNEISPTGGKPGTPVTIKGEGFSLILAENTVKFNGRAGQIKKTTETSMEVIAPQDGTTGKVTVTVRDKSAGGPVFTYLTPDQPQIISISPKVGWDYTLNAVTITGKNFGDDQSKVTVTFDGKAASLQSFSATKLIVAPPKHAVGKVKVKVVVNEKSSNSVDYIYQQKPVIQVVYKHTSDSLSPYYLSVTNLDQQNAAIKVLVNGNHQVSIDSIYRKGTDEYIKEPEGDKIALKRNDVDQFVSSFDVDFVVSSNGIKSDPAHFENDPIITNVTSPGKEAYHFSGGDTVTVTGKYLNPDTKNATIELWTKNIPVSRLQPDPKVVSWSNTKIEIVIPDYKFNYDQQIGAVALQLWIRINGQSAHNDNADVIFEIKQKQQQAGEVEYTGSATIPARAGLVAAGAGNKIVFAGGSGPSAEVDIYDVTTNSWTQWHLSVARSALAAAAAGNKIVFAGGYDGDSPSNMVDIYDVSTGQWATAQLSEARQGLAAAAAGNKILFGGGYGSSGFSNTVDIYDVTSGQWTVSHLSQARYELCAAGAGNKVVFAGGHAVGIGSPLSIVDIYDVNTGTWTTTHLSEAKYWHTAAAAGNKIIFAGGYTGGNDFASKTVDIYDVNTGTWSTAQLSQARRNLAATGLGDKILIGGGVAGDTQSHRSAKTVDVYDIGTGEWTTMELSVDRTNLAAAAAGNEILFGGGAVSRYTYPSGTSVTSSVVDIFTLK